MRTLKSLTFLGLLAVAATLLAAACNDGGDDGGTTTGETPSVAETPATGETPSVGETPVEGETPPAGETPEDGGGGDGATSAAIRMVPSVQFDTDELTIAAGTDVTIDVTNEDSGLRHNFAVFESADAAAAGDDPIDETSICAAPCEDSVTVNLDSGEYYFRCQVHPSRMTGTLVAE